MSEGPVPSVLVVDDEPASVSLLRITLGTEFTTFTATSGDEALATLAEHPDIAVAIVDQRMPGMTGTELIQRSAGLHPHVVNIILTGYTDVDALIAAINTGQVYRYLTKPWNKDELRATVRRAAELHALARDNRRLQQELERANAHLRVENAELRREACGKYRFEELVGTGPAMRRLLDLIERVVATESTVLITGETGTGKELVARAIHYNGPRAEKPFVSENCGALAPDILTSELFGHRRGAFTGAVEDRKGLFELAHGGTLFLDEIGDCPPDLQVRLLRVLDQGEIRRVGDGKTIKVDVRIIAATHHDLERDAAEGRFRRDLYYRLGVFRVTTPPLRDRKEDIPLLVKHVLERLDRGRSRGVLGCTPETIARLAAYDFPGNVRELENELERAYALTDAGSYVTPDLLSSCFGNGAAAEPPSTDTDLRSAMEKYEASLVRAALARNDRNQTRTAVELGLSRRSLIDKIQKYGLR